MNKEKKLEEILKSYKRVIIAFSGGLDSSFLLFFARKILGKENVKAITIYSPYKISEKMLKETKNIANFIGVEQTIFNTELSEEIKNNPIDRCYHCKKEIFARIKEIADKEGFILCDGTNYDDLSDYRPGLKALKELDVKSPLLEANFTKKDIKDYSKKYKLPFWNKMPDSCFLTRIPSNTEIKLSTIKMIKRSEEYLKEIGFNLVRVRVHDNIARIEIGEKEMKKVLKIKTLKKIDIKLKEIGFKYVTLDCRGYNG
ncbi:MAG: ATP-dependent sacrificial sulfur transferase LarE [Brevinematia bacterium]